MERDRERMKRDRERNGKKRDEWMIPEVH